MQVLEGKYNQARVYTDSLEKDCRKQIIDFLNHPAFKDVSIAVMPDVHAGKGSVIGFTMTMSDYIIPNMIGVDIGCGVLAVELGERDISFSRLDNFIRRHIPAAFNVNESVSQLLDEELKKKMVSIAKKIGSDENRDIRAVGSLGGGNHFIEIDRSEKDGHFWLVIHSGSRHFGLAVAEYHQKKAKKYAEKNKIEIPKGQEYLPIEEGGREYIEDMKVAQQMACTNRRIIATRIVEGFFDLDMEKREKVESIHNYINFNDNIIRKGAISAHQGEKLIIPFNMRDGSLIAEGKGNREWNFSAPHGAGRTMSRHQAKKNISMEKYQESMKKVWTTCVNKKTLDEAPFAYKDKDKMLKNIEDTVSVLFLMKPVYNFKGT